MSGFQWKVMHDTWNRISTGMKEWDYELTDIELSDRVPLTRLFQQSATSTCETDESIENLCKGLEDTKESQMEIFKNTIIK